jgi:hypothetical protein
VLATPVQLLGNPVDYRFRSEVIPLHRQEYRVFSRFFASAGLHWQTGWFMARMLE